MYDRLWNEIALIKYHYEYIILYLDWHKSIRKWIKITTTLFSAGGVFGWKIFETTLPQIACSGIAIIQLLTLVEGHIYMSDDKMEKGAEMKVTLHEYLLKLEEAWYKVRRSKLNEDELANIFFELKNKYGTKIQELENKVDLRDKKKLMLKADKYMRDYLELFIKSK